MKEQRLQQAFDAHNPDEAAVARMWAAVESAWDRIAEEEGEAEAHVEEESRNATEITMGTAEAVAAGTSRTAGFTVTAGANASKRRRRYSWKVPTVAAVLVVAIGAGILFFTDNGSTPGPTPGGNDPEIIVPDDPTPLTPGTDDPDDPGEAAVLVEWQGAQYVEYADTPVDDSLVGERLGEGSLLPAKAGDAAKPVEVFAAKGRYATGAYIVVQLDGVYYLFIARA